MKLGPKPIKCPHCGEWARSPEEVKKINHQAFIFAIKWGVIGTILLFLFIVVIGLIVSGGSQLLLENTQYDHTVISGMNSQHFTLKHNVTIDKIEVRIGSHVPGINRVTLKVFDWRNKVAECSVDLSGYYPYAEDTDGNPSYGWVTFDFDDFELNANKDCRIMLFGSVYGEYLAQAPNGDWNYKIYGWNMR